MADTKRIEVRGVPGALFTVITKRAADLGMSRSAYMQHVAAADCARAGLWLPEPDRVQPADTPISGSSENPQ